MTRCPSCGYAFKPEPEVGPETRALFERFWTAYPKRGGHSNPKRDALRRFAELLGEGIDPDHLIRQAEKYGEWIKVKGHTKTSFVKQAAAWLLSGRWEADFTIGWHMLSDARDEEERDALTINLEAYLSGNVRQGKTDLRGDQKGGMVVP